ncbi:hypothetical protein QFZ77_007625 [Paenibacillus sp. V4I3]|uniref:hypothetical protein n=1 Tax=Paenibacillus sp. V4I3 TaxID=3042305 RepID=UPI002786CF53|nr:hypothetical protein [Paenibacillus sp. V4I3]MDQ0878966.1 hypothetical protein [Paenibacillus sp. V4I3]
MGQFEDNAIKVGVESLNKSGIVFQGTSTFEGVLYAQDYLRTLQDHYEGNLAIATAQMATGTKTAIYDQNKTQKSEAEIRIRTYFQD